MLFRRERACAKKLKNANKRSHLYTCRERNPHYLLLLTLFGVYHKSIKLAVTRSIRPVRCVNSFLPFILLLLTCLVSSISFEGIAFTSRRSPSANVVQSKVSIAFIFIEYFFFLSLFHLLRSKTMIFHRQQMLLAVIFCGVVAMCGAISKKSDENGGPMSPNGNQPIYTNPGAGGPYSVPTQYNPNSGPEHGAQGMQQGAPQNNLYYYYYPVQDKPKETASAYGGNQPMSHSTSSVHDTHDHGPMDTAASGSEISYSAQDLAQDQYGGQGTQGFDQQTLNNFASQLQMGFNNAQNYDANNGQMPNFGQNDASGHMSQVHNGYNGAMANSGGQMAFAPQGPYGGQAGFGGFGGPNGNGQQVQTQSSEITSSITSGLRKYGLTSILMPVLALAGLSLLLPTVTSLGTTTTKTKRSIDEQSPVSAYLEKADIYYKLYNKAMEKEECMNRMICEMGDAVSGVRGRSALLMVVENLAPQWMEKKMAVFKSGALSKEMSKCKKYAC